MPKSPASSSPITPIPIPSAELRKLEAVLFFGGTFDPPHAYHAIAPMLALTMLYGESGWLLYVPAAQSPLKPRTPVAGDKDRLRMLELALEIKGRRSIWTDEIDRAKANAGKPSYTIDTLRRARQVLPAKVNLRLVIGSDHAAQFHLWRKPREILKIARPLVLPRDPISTPTELWLSLTETGFWTRKERREWCECFAPTLIMPAASTSIRDSLPQAPPDARMWTKDPQLRLVPPLVADHILTRGLYRA